MKREKRLVKCAFDNCDYRFKSWGNRKHCPEHQDEMRLIGARQQKAKVKVP